MSHRNKLWRLAILPAAVAAVVFVSQRSNAPVAAQEQQAASEIAAPVTSIEATKATAGAPVVFVPQFLDAPPVEGASPEVLAARERMEELKRVAWMQRSLPSVNSPITGPGDAAATDPDAKGGLGIEVEDMPGPNAPGTLTLFESRSLFVPPGFTSNAVAEPALSQSGKYIWYTQNWYAARSTNGGTKFTYVNPFTDMPDFCCDQDTVYDKGRNMYLWYRQGVAPSASVPNQQNRFFLSRSTNEAATWCTYDIRPTNMGITNVGYWFDYPKLALSNDYLYITTNMFNAGGGFVQMMLLKMPLDAISTCSGFNFSVWTKTSGWTWSPVDGATDRMYIGDHVDQNTMSIHWNDEDSNTLSSVNVDLPFTWTATNRNSSCPVLGGANPCLRADQRIIGGWVRRPAPSGTISNGQGEVGFFWNVKEGGGFAKPYTEAATFNESNLTYRSRPLIWWPDFAWFYAAVAPNDRGDLGVSVYLFSPSANPAQYVAIDDDFNNQPPGWGVALAKSSTRTATSNNWGDYSRVRSFQPQGVSWITSGLSLQNNVKYPDLTLYSGPITHLTKFGRGRDLAGHNRYKLK